MIGNFPGPFPRQMVCEGSASTTVISDGNKRGLDLLDGIVPMSHVEFKNVNVACLCHQ